MTNSASDAEQPITRTTREVVGSIPANERGHYIGGLMRCCTLTLHESTEPTFVGSVLECRYCRNKMVVSDDGAWKWVGTWIKL